MACLYAWTQYKLCSATTTAVQAAACAHTKIQFAIMPCILSRKPKKIYSMPHARGKSADSTTLKHSLHDYVLLSFMISPTANHAFM